MSATLASVRAQAAQFLQDPGNQIFDANALDGGIRVAMADYSRATGTLAALSGLDGGGATSFGDLDAEVIAVGAAAYCAVGRIFKRGESFQTRQYLPKELRTWGEARLRDFRELLEQVRAGTLRKDTVTPWAATGWALDPWDPNTLGNT